LGPHAMLITPFLGRSGKAFTSPHSCLGA
jgi:hypothetical protein